MGMVRYCNRKPGFQICNGDCLNCSRFSASPNPPEEVSQMSVKKAPIHFTENVYLVHDEDKAIMEFSGYDTEHHKFKYVCPICGHTEYHERSYPYQINHFDRSKEEDLSES